MIDEAGQEHTGGSWFHSGGELVSENASFRCQVFQEPHPHYSLFRFVVTFSSQIAVDRFFMRQKLLAHDLYFSDRHYRWRPQSESLETLDSLTPAQLAGNTEIGRIGLQFRRHAMLQLEETSGSFTVYFDHMLTHPRVAFEKEMMYRRDTFPAKPDIRLILEAYLFIRTRTANSLISPLPWRFPNRALSCMVITDHADWDTAEKIEALYSDSSGIRGTRVKTTKSVFYATVGHESINKSFQPDGLDVPAFATQIDSLHEAGHEVCPHSFSVRPKRDVKDLPRETALSVLDLFAERYQSGTWIDHGRFERFNYSQLGWDSSSPWYLVDLLHQRGFSAIWSYYDTLRYPVNHINQLGTGDMSNDLLKYAARKALTAEFWKAVNYGKLSLDLRLGREGRKQVLELANFLKIAVSTDLTKSAKLRRLVRRGLKLPRLIFTLPYWLSVEGGEYRKASLLPSLFSSKALPFGQITDQDMVMFTSVLVNNFSDAWRNLTNLVAERGIHIAHTYLCNTTLKYGDQTLIKRENRWVLTDLFAERLSEIDERISRNEIWNPTMKACSDWFKLWIQIYVEPIGPNAIRVTNPTYQPAVGYTLLFPDTVRQVVSEGHVLEPTSESLSLFSITINPNSSIEMSWG
ncbi:MAG: hypothetical protein JNL42_00155 [Anaerolineae bacterium]|nr:hypothetical protein [Anaerolineae bacterium]